LNPGEDMTVSLHHADHLDPEVEVHVEHGMTGVLILRRGTQAGETFVLNAPVSVVGRNPESEIFLDDITVSRKHAEVRVTPDGYTVRDCGSLNGTYVNRSRISELTLHSGDEVQIGKFRLVFLSAAEHRRMHQ
jgi:pSer/pThr/pTyr-binding forkhead associated (FHA) protein